ncbi:c-type cytochrome [Variovorax dokdonensis]|uniref:C-type cytochrome n=1 Tax=Variovorax dokdonensis TaxID=344883 RepID=A0ABT7N779_9BURK|nr:c-type cytochrome [Variovorax dokdonensis]MDM0043801.1 c-type cytochrome [Variovorax dokdonensis]
MKQRARIAALAAAAALTTSIAAPAAAQGKVDYAKRYEQTCAACHGAKGVSTMPGAPSLAGQHSFYAVTQLFLYREGRRSNEMMSAVAKTLTDDDLRGFSDFIGTLPPVPVAPPAGPVDADRMARGKALSSEHKCVFCHGADFSGGQQVPRLTGQTEDYLKGVLQGYKSGKRVGYTMAMIEAVSRTTPEDLDTLAYYLARFSAASPAPAAGAPAKK